MAAAAHEEMRPLVVGVSHHTSGVELRDRLLLRDESAARVSDAIAAHPAVGGVVVLCTCNRCDVTVATTDPDAGAAAVEAAWAAETGVLTAELDAAAYVQSDTEALRHLLRVGCSLDSMVVGESQIFGQVKDAFFGAQERGFVNFYLDLVFREVIRVGKRVRTETAINEGAVSISYAAVELARKVLGRLEDKCVGVIGSGEMGDLAARHLHKAGARDFIIFNRSRGNAEELAARFDAEVCLLERMDQALHRCDVVICATDAPGTVLTKEHVQTVMPKREDRRMFIIDIAAPRDVEPEVGEMLNTYLFSIDDLHDVVRDNERKREAAVGAADEIVEAELETLLGRTRGLAIRPIIRELRAQYESIAEDEIRKAARTCSSEEQERLAFLGRSLLNKFLHQPLTRLREIGEQGDGASAGAYARELFGLNADQQERPPAGSEVPPDKGGSSG